MKIKCTPILLPTKNIRQHFQIVKNSTGLMALTIPYDHVGSSLMTTEGIAFVKEIKSYELYLIADERIRKGEWVYDTQEKILFQSIGDFQENPTGTYRKVITSTDPNLKVPIIPINWLEKVYVEKQGNIEEIEIEMNIHSACNCDTMEKLFKCPFTCSGADGEPECLKRFPDGSFWKKEITI